jgi:hypothetical protein
MSTIQKGDVSVRRRAEAEDRLGLTVNEMIVTIVAVLLAIGFVFLVLLGMVHVDPKSVFIPG